MSERLNNRESRTRGRIASVLAEARATLKEPSRPITPASLDARVDKIPGAINSGSIRGSRRPDIGGGDMNKINSHLYGIMDKKYQRDKKNANFSSSNSTSAEYFSFDKLKQDYEDDNGDISLIEDSFGIDQTGGNSKSGFDSTLLIMDIEDSNAMIEAELQGVQLDVQKMQQILESMSLTIDKFTKYLQSIGFKQHKDIYDKLIDTLSRILDTTQSRTLRQHSCRHILRLLLMKYPAQEVLSSDARVLLRTTRDLYLCASEGEDKEDTESNEDKSYESDIQCSIMVQGGVDQVLDFLNIVWAQSEILFKSKDRFSSDEPAYAPVKKGEKLFGNIGSYKMFLEAGVYAAGIVRIFSIKETNRKRLCHVNAMSGLTDGLRIVLRIVADCKKRQWDSKPQCNDDNEASDNEIDEDLTGVKRDETIALSQLGYIVVQIISVIRNFSLESIGRQQLQSCSTIVAVCYLLNAFQSNAELILNCVRVTAKLSQFEPFRVQLNKKPKYVSYLAKIIAHEGEMCHNVMEGNDDVSWPSWHTWPLLSRTAFTLGNLTTNNDSNRALIANDCKCLIPIVILLQTCSCSLMHLFSSNADDSSEGGAESDVDVDYDRSSVGDSDSNNLDNEFKTDKEPPRSSGNKNYVPSSFNQNENEDDGSAESELSDATVKLLRLFANLSINEEIGLALAKRRDVTKMLLELLACSDTGQSGREELHLNVVAACTNLTYYSCRVESSPSARSIADLQSLAARLSNCLFHENKEVVLESARALGNLTRNEQVIESLCSSRAAEALVLLLGHADFDILGAVTGALVNISANRHSLSCLAESSQPAQNLAFILRKSSFKNLNLTTLVCQVFHNLLLHGKEGFDDIVRNALGNSLFELVDAAEDMIDDDNDSDHEEEGVNRYSHFATVGRLILDFLAEES